jgi:hopene-associated glycosyltransferase HpnB
VLSLTLTLLSFISLMIWIVLTFFRGGFWRLRAFDDDVAGHERLESWPDVIAIVPARNEAETIAQTVESLAAQTYPGRLQIIVVNDHSEDATAEIVRRISEAGDVPHLVSVLESETLPDGWTGKIWAMRQGARKATESAPQYLWFTDADIVHAPDTLERLVSRAEPQNLDLVSLMVLLQAKSFAERLLIPAFLYFFLTLYVPRWIANPKSGTAGAAGGCVLLRRSALERIGGFAAIRTEVIDDCALARAVKHSGGSIWMGLTRSSVSLRAYSSFSEVRDMIARTAFTQLNYSLLILLGTLVGLIFTYLLPVFAVLSGQTLALLGGIAAWLLMSLTYFPTVKFYGLPGWWAPLLPAAAAFYAYATCLSAVRYWLGRGGQWKGRAQAPAGR